MWIFSFPEASKISEWLTAKWPLWDDLIQSPAAFQHLLWSLEAAFYFHTWFWRTERVTHQPRRHLGNGKLHKEFHKRALTVVLTPWPSYSGDFLSSLSPKISPVPRIPDCYRTADRQGCSHLMPQCTSGLQEGSQLTCPLLNIHGHLVMRK